MYFSPNFVMMLIPSHYLAPMYVAKATNWVKASM